MSLSALRTLFGGRKQVLFSAERILARGVGRKEWIVANRLACRSRPRLTQGADGELGLLPGELGNASDGLFNLGRCREWADTEANGSACFAGS